jgi:outer membrane receptor protein involved in Fe transport
VEGKTVNDLFYSGTGKAYGVEFFLQKKMGRFAGWIGYGLGWVYAKFDSINGGNEFRPKYDRRYDLKVVAQYELNDNWTFGATFMFQSGQSYTGALSRFQTEMPGGDNVGYGKVQPSQRYGLRMPPSHQLNVTASYNTTVFSLPFKVTLDIYNVYSRRDILMRTYNVNNENSALEDVRLLPILPTISFELKY